MLYEGHAKTGAIITATAALCICLQRNEPLASAVTITGIAALIGREVSAFPDLDSKTSKINKKLPFVMPLIRLVLVVYFLFNMFYLKDNMEVLPVIKMALCVFVFVSLSHRKILHSAWIIIAAYYATNRGIDFLSTKFALMDVFILAVSIGITAGIFSHIWGDMHTTDGCRSLYPLNITFRLARFKSGEDDKKITKTIVMECIMVVLFFLFWPIIKENLMNFLNILNHVIQNLLQHLPA